LLILVPLDLAYGHRLDNATTPIVEVARGLGGLPTTEPLRADTKTFSDFYRLAEFRISRELLGKKGTSTSRRLTRHTIVARRSY
jgi:hypothetical protein